MKRQLSELGKVKLISGLKDARLYLEWSQEQIGNLVNVDQAIVSKAERGKCRLGKDDKDTQAKVAMIAVEVARAFRIRTERDDYGLKYFYNSPLRFEAWGICREHRKPYEYRLERLGQKCPKCKKRGA